MHIKKTLSMVIVSVLIVFNMTTTILAENNLSQENTQKIQSIDDGAMAIIGSNTDSIERISTASATPSGVVRTRVHCIGSGLVDLDTTITASTMITSVYGNAWFNSTSGKKIASLNRSGGINSTFFNDSAQFSMTKGTVISTCGSSGVVVFNFLYSYPFETVPYDLIAVVY